jgi:hypothetical protein
MSNLNPRKLHVEFMDGTYPQEPKVPRAYTLTHSDATGDLFLTVGSDFNLPQISGWYTRFMRDEVTAVWNFHKLPNLRVHCHVSGGIVFGLPGWRKSIFRQHMPMVLQAFRYGDREFFAVNPDLEEAKVWVYFHARQRRYNSVESWGRIAKYNILKNVD